MQYIQRLRESFLRRACRRSSTGRGAASAVLSLLLVAHAPASTAPEPLSPASRRGVQQVFVNQSGGGNYTSIQAAVNGTVGASQTVIIVWPGTYTAGGAAVVSIADRDIVIVAADSANPPVIDGQMSRRGIIVSRTTRAALKVVGVRFANCVGTAISSPIEAESRGGAILDNLADRIEIEDCVFENCHAENGGAIGRFSGFSGSSYTQSITVIRRCTFTSCKQACQLAAWRPIVEDCSFSSCFGGWGGAIRTAGATIRRCQFNGNGTQGASPGTVTDFGGAVSLWYGTEASRIEDCSFVGNVALRGGALSVLADWPQPVLHRNSVIRCRFTSNMATSATLGGGGAIFGCNWLEIADCEFTGNVGMPGRSLRVDPIRPAIATGCTFDTCCPAWPLSGITLSSDTAAPVLCPDCPGDLDCSGTVDGADIGIMLSDWGPLPQSIRSDANGDGIVDGADLGLLLVGWGPCPL